MEANKTGIYEKVLVQIEVKGEKKARKRRKLTLLSYEGWEKKITFWISISHTNVEHRFSNKITLEFFLGKDWWLSKCSMCDLYWYFELWSLFSYSSQEKKIKNLINRTLFWLIEFLTFLLFYLISPLTLNLMW